MNREERVLSKATISTGKNTPNTEHDCYITAYGPRD